MYLTTQPYVTLTQTCHDTEARREGWRPSTGLTLVTTVVGTLVDIAFVTLDMTPVDVFLLSTHQSAVGSGWSVWAREPCNDIDDGTFEDDMSHSDKLCDILQNLNYLVWQI